MKTKQVSNARLRVLSLCGVALAMLGSSAAYAASICTNPPPPISVTFPPLTFEGGADGPPVGQPISSGWGTGLVSPTFFSGGPTCLITRGVVLPKAAWTQPTGLTYTEDGVTYRIYNTTVPGIGIILGIKATSASGYVPIQYPVTEYLPANSPELGMGIDIKAKLIVIDRLSSGIYTFTSQPLFNVYANGVYSSSANSVVAEGRDLILNPSTVTITARTCQMSSATTQNVPLLPVGKNQFSGVGSSAGGEANFSLTTLCDSGVKLYATMTDGSDPGNTGNILKPAEGTTASGVGVQILRNGFPISFGPDSSAFGNTNQWYIGTAGSGGSEPFTIPLKARYVQTAQNMVAGSVKARATVTFSYQ